MITIREWCTIKGGKETAEKYTADKKEFTILRDLFDQLYYEFQMQSRRKPDEPLNPYKSMKINSILEPLRKLMAGEEYAGYLDLVDTTQEEGNENSISGKTYSDVALMLTQYKGAMKRFFHDEF